MKIEYNDLSGWLKFAVFGQIISAMIMCLFIGALIAGLIMSLFSY